jgi:hypothetical protein
MNKIFIILGSLFLISYILQTIPLFLDAYEKQIKFLETENWRIESCKDPKFFNEMQNLNSDVCTSLTNKQKTIVIKSPIVVAFTACLPFQNFIHVLFSSKVNQHNYHYTTILFFLIITIYVVHNIFMPMYALWLDRNEHLKLLEECSPMLHGRKRRNNVTWEHYGAIIKRNAQRLFHAP